jgi:hypothetical protein
LSLAAARVSSTSWQELLLHIMGPAQTDMQRLNCTASINQPLLIQLLWLLLCLLLLLLLHLPTPKQDMHWHPVPLPWQQ